MAKHTPPLSDEQLQQALVELSRQIAYPPTRDLAEVVRARLQATPPGGSATTPSLRQDRGWRRYRLRTGWRLAAALLAILLVLIGVLALSAGARATLSRWLGLPGVVFITHPTVPTPAPQPVGAALQLGQRVTFAAAQRQLPYRLLMPTQPAFARPDEVYLEHLPPPGQVSLVYRARPGLPRAGQIGVGLLLTEFIGDLNPERIFFMKGMEPGTRVEQISVNGEPGYWLSGRPHLFLYLASNGEVQTEDIRLAGNTMLWQHGQLTLRLESSLGKQAALRIATSMR